MRPPPPGFALLEVVLGLVVLGLVGSVVLQGSLGVTRAVRDGRRATALALAGAGLLDQLERDYRRGRPACVTPPAGSLATGGMLASWTMTGLASAADIVLVLDQRARAGSADTVATRVTCR